MPDILISDHGPVRTVRMNRPEKMRHLSLRPLCLGASLAAALTGAQSHADSSAAGDAAPAAAPAATERVLDLPLAGSDRQRVLYLSPPRPRGSIVMLPGGAGDVGISRHGRLRHGHNFVVRTRRHWVARGYAVLIPDALNHENLRGLRSSPRYAAVIAGLVQFAHTQAPVPVFLLGTSQGSIAAMNGAAHLGPAEISGVVLTESVSRMGGSHETVFDAQPQAVTVPALVVANRDDNCPVSSPSDAQKIVQAMTKSPEVRVLEVKGGTTRSRDCGSLSPHGYYGIESTVVDAIVNWLNARTGK
jgi:hypothetical protein